MGSRPVGSLYFIALLARLSTPELTKNSLMAAKRAVLHSSESGKVPSAEPPGGQGLVQPLVWAYPAGAGQLLRMGSVLTESLALALL